jgi:hypothetical protein
MDREEYFVTDDAKTPKPGEPEPEPPTEPTEPPLEPADPDDDGSTQPQGDPA